MKFTKYNSIENTYREKTIEQIRFDGLEDGLWEVSNKIDGANFSVHYDGKEIRYAKRSGFIGGNEDFYNFRSIEEKLESYIKKAWAYLKSKYVTFECLSIYGELFGGSYPNIKSNVKAIQNRVKYSPEIEFYAVDIKVDTFYLDFDYKIDVFKNSDIPYSPILFTGTFDECLEFSPIFEDPIYKDFGLEKVEGNMSEGIVIKSFIPKFFGCGSRVILKNKNPKFSEKEKTKKKKQKIEYSPELSKEIEELESFVNENRLRSALSKIGDVTDKDFGKIMKELNSDVLEDYMRENSQKYNELEKSEQKLLFKSLNQSSSTLIRENFLNIIDRNF